MKKYTKPELECCMFYTEVILTSSPNGVYFLGNNDNIIGDF